MNIYVGNLSFQVTEGELRHKFKAFGKVDSVNIIQDRFSGKSRGFGFVEMASDDEGLAAINGLNGKMLGERTLTVNQARARREDDRSGRATISQRHPFDNRRS